MDGTVWTKILMLVLGCLFLLVFCFIYYIDYLKQKNIKEQKQDPIYKGFLIAALISAVLFLAEGVGFFTRGWNQQHYYLHLILPTCIIIVYFWVISKNNPLCYEDLVDYAYKYLGLTFPGIKIPVGKAKWHAIKMFKIEKSGFGEFDEYASFVMELTDYDISEFFISLNLYTGSPLHIQEGIPRYLKDRLIGARTTARKDALVNEFNLEPEQKQELRGDRIDRNTE